MFKEFLCRVVVDKASIVCMFATDIIKIASFVHIIEFVFIWSPVQLNINFPCLISFIHEDGKPPHPISLQLIHSSLSVDVQNRFVCGVLA